MKSNRRVINKQRAKASGIYSELESFEKENYSVKYGDAMLEPL